MTTEVMTLSEYADLVSNLAEAWDDEEPIVLIGDRNGNVNISDKGGHTQHGTVGYANEIFDTNGVHTLSQGDARFYETMLLGQSDLPEDIVERVLEVDYDTSIGGGDGE